MNYLKSIYCLLYNHNLCCLKKINGLDWLQEKYPDTYKQIATDISIPVNIYIYGCSRCYELVDERKKFERKIKEYYKTEKAIAKVKEKYQSLLSDDIFIKKMVEKAGRPSILKRLFKYKRRNNG